MTLVKTMDRGVKAKATACRTRPGNAAVYKRKRRRFHSSKRDERRQEALRLTDGF
jgi:hypothetical protein